MSSWTEEQIEEHALKFRRHIGIEDDQVLVDAIGLLFKLKHFFGINYERLLNDELPSPGGQWDAKQRCIRLNETVFRGANDPTPSPHHRWTIAHEVSHAVFGDEGIRNRSPKDSFEKRISSRTRAIETRTDRFAAALLAPLRLIKENESAESIALRFGLSKPAAVIRAEEAARAFRKRQKIKREVPEKTKKIIEELKSQAFKKKL